MSGSILFYLSFPFCPFFWFFIFPLTKDKHAHLNTNYYFPLYLPLCPFAFPNLQFLNPNPTPPPLPSHLWLHYGFTIGQFHQPEFPEAVQGSSSHQAAEAGRNHPHLALDLRSILQGLPSFLQANAHNNHLHEQINSAHTLSQSC